MSHALSRIGALVLVASPLPAHADTAFQVDPTDSAFGQATLAIAQISPSIASLVSATIDQAGSGTRMLVAAPLSANAVSNAFVEQAAGLAIATTASADPSGNASLINQLGLGNSAIVAQTGSFDTSLIVQSGTGNECSVVQTSNGNLSIVSQAGTNNFVSIHQG